MEYINLKRKNFQNFKWSLYSDFNDEMQWTKYKYSD